MVKNVSVNKETGFVVEKIVDKRITADSRVEYFIKWRGYPSSENSWEPEENCDCPAIIQRFEESRAKSKKRGFEKKPKVEEIQKPRGYDRSLDIEEILGATDANGDVSYLVKWHLCDEFDLVDGAELRQKNPEILIAFYEKRSQIQKNINQRLQSLPNKIKITGNAVDKPVKTDDTPLNEGYENARKNVSTTSSTSTALSTTAAFARTTTKDLLNNADAIPSDSNSNTASDIAHPAIETNANANVDVN